MTSESGNTAMLSEQKSSQVAKKTAAITKLVLCSDNADSWSNTTGEDSRPVPSDETEKTTVPFRSKPRKLDWWLTREMHRELDSADSASDSTIGKTNYQRSKLTVGLPHKLDSKSTPLTWNDVISDKLLCFYNDCHCKVIGGAPLQVSAGLPSRKWVFSPQPSHEETRVEVSSPVNIDTSNGTQGRTELVEEDTS